MRDQLNQPEPDYELPDYKYLRPLGRGRFAHVYLATQISLNRPVAVKVLADADEEFLSRFEREAEVMAKVSHPNIVSVIDRGIMKGQHFIVMEFMDGGSLRDRMTPDHPMELSAACAAISAVATALSNLHGMGLIHRDVKPDNVLFDRKGQIKLCDFGIAAPLGQVGQLTDVNASPGTVDYMAPEQRHRLGVSREADQFALAVMAYELLTGKLPTQVFRQASAKNSLLNESVDAVLERALQEEPESRFPSVAAFAAALEAALGSNHRETDEFKLATSGRTSLVLSVLVVALCAMGVYLGTLWKAEATTQNESEPAAGTTESVQDANASESPVNAETIQQTGALTYRLDSSGKCEVLVVTARVGGHWTIPKANQKKEESLSAVAEAEGFEESGIRGKAFSVVLGRYTYRRNDRRYEVSVVPVEFTEELHDWPESSRERRWGPVDEISSIVTSDRLRQIIESFSPDAVRADLK